MSPFILWADAVSDPSVNRTVLFLFPLMVLPLLLPAAFRHVFPTRQMFTVFLVPLIASLSLFVIPSLAYAVLALDGVIVLFLLMDMLTVPIFRTPFSAERATERIVSLTKPHGIRLTVKNHSLFRYRIQIQDDVPDAFHQESAPFEERRLPGKSQEILEYHIQGSVRGLFKMETAAVRVKSLCGFWIRDFRLPCESELCVYPNLQQISQYEILARTDRLYQLGVRTVRRVGYDNDFERLRDYQLDDQFKFIDWMATARRNKLTVRDFQTSRSQRIVFLIDSGRMMTGESRGLNLLDHSLNAMLMLSYVALRQSDEVGMLSFSNRIINYIPVASGRRQMNRLLHGCFDLFPEHVESRYDDAFAYLSSRCRKRALVILVTNIADEVNADRVEKHLRNLSGKHLPFGVFLRDHQIFDAVSVEDTSGSRDFWAGGAAAQILNWRHKAITDLSRQGTLTLDVFPEEMTAPLINRYLEIKARQLL
jgi:uncharacterized protein (DUF58 family)